MSGSVSSGPHFWVNGRPGHALPLPDRGLEFGDGLFETLLLLDGVPQFPEFHERRLRRGFECLRFAGATPELASLIAPALDRAAGFQRAALRLTLSRAAGSRGYPPGQGVDHRCVLRLTPIGTDAPAHTSPATLGVSSMALASQPALAGIKHLNRLEQVLAAREAAQSGADDMVMLDQAGKVVSTTAGNLYMFAQGKIHTPRIGDCGIAGTRRKLLLEQWAPALGLEVVQRDLDPAELVSAEELFYSNSLWGLRPVGELGARLFQHHPVCNALFTQYLAGLE